MIQKTVFINFTNHPIAQWSEEQLRAAEQIGELMEIPFPLVSPEATAEEVGKMADEQVKGIVRMADGHSATVHIAGEHTLTFAIVTRLRAKGIKCVASTTYRSTVQLPDGTEIRDFNFIQFREY